MTDVVGGFRSNQKSTEYASYANLDMHRTCSSPLPPVAGSGYQASIGSSQAWKPELSTIFESRADDLQRQRDYLHGAAANLRGDGQASRTELLLTRSLRLPASGGQASRTEPRRRRDVGRTRRSHARRRRSHARHARRRRRGITHGPQDRWVLVVRVWAFFLIWQVQIANYWR
jgi:hypothetical protein